MVGSDHSPPSNDPQEMFHFLSSPARRASKKSRNTENTIVGVFLPCIGSILNAILFLRLPFITAQAGAIQTTLIIIVCATSTLITAISLSAIATNGKIMQGGAYFVVSRTLGLEVGGALGLLYYLGSTMACSICVLGGVEAFLLAVFGDNPTVTDTTNGALGGSYESLEDIEIGDGLARRFLINDPIVETSEMPGNLAPESMKFAVEQEMSPGIAYFSAGDSEALSIMLVFLLATFVATGYRSALTVSSHVFLALTLFSIFSSFLGSFLFAFHQYSGNLSEIDFQKMDNIYPRYEPDNKGTTPTFVSLLSLFYPGVTGILAGSYKSENLTDPSQSIPNGTISAVICSTFVYLSFTWLFGTTIANQTLKSRKFLVSAIAYPSPLLLKFLFLVSVIGAALGYMSSATTLLSAIAMDDSMPILDYIRRGNSPNLGKGQFEKHPDIHSADDQKINRRALGLTLVLVSLPTLSGNLDRVTPFISMCYLLMYSGINCSCFLLGISNSPGFRPSFKYFHWSISLIGFIWCLALALLIDTAMACLALAMFLILLTYNSKMMEKRRDWGDVFDSVKYDVVTKTLHSLNDTTTSHLNAKNWRPQLLTFVDMNSHGLPTNTCILSLASQLKRARGINIVVGIIQRDLCQSQHDLEGHQGIEDERIVRILSDGKRALQLCMEQEHMNGFAEVSGTTGQGMCDAVWSAVLHSGLGCLSPNTILLSYPERAVRNGANTYWTEKDFLRAITGIRNLNVALMIFKGSDYFPRSQELVTSGIIDLWWIMHDGGLLLLIPYIMSKNAVWGKASAKLRIFAVITSSTYQNNFEEAVKTHLKGARIIAEVKVVNMSDYSLEEDMRIGLSSNIDSQSSNHDKTLVEAFCEVQESVPYIRLSEQTDIHNNNNTHHSDNSSYNSRELLTNENDENCFQKIQRSRERTRNATALNEIIRLHSSVSNLVVVNAPSEYSTDFFDYVDTMCDGIENTLLIRGSGKEIITTFA